MDEEPLGMEDTVRIRDTEATRQLGLAGLSGQVCGDTIPSVTGAEVIGGPGGDYAIAVKFEDHTEPYWFAPELLELLERGVETRDPNVEKAVEALYATFADYGPQQEFCTFCYSEDEIEHLRSTPLRNLSEECARKLLYEVSDHWQSAETYRHYLPRMLDIFAPPISCGDSYEGHLFETLRYFEFRNWPKHEQTVVRDYFAAITPFIDESDREAWLQRIESL